MIKVRFSLKHRLIISPSEYLCDEKGKMQNKFLGSVPAKQQVMEILVCADCLILGNGKRRFSFPVFLTCVLFPCNHPSLACFCSVLYFRSEPKLNIWPQIFRPTDKPVDTIFGRMQSPLQNAPPISRSVTFNPISSTPSLPSY